MKTIIAGGRDARLNFNNCRKLNEIADDITEVVSGGAGGIDSDGEKWARFRNIPVKQFPADWLKYGRQAGPLRNREMAQYADALVAFPGGAGTADMVRRAHRAGLYVYDWRNGGSG